MWPLMQVVVEKVKSLNNLHIFHIEILHNCSIFSAHIFLFYDIYKICGEGLTRGIGRGGFQELPPPQH